MRAVYSVLTVGVLACKAGGASLVTPPPPTAPVSVSVSVSEPPPAPVESVRVPDGKEPVDGGVEIRVYSARDL